MTAFAKRPSRKLLLALLSMLLVASGLVLALPDTTPTAEATAEPAEGAGTTQQRKGGAGWLASGARLAGHSPRAPRAGLRPPTLGPQQRPPDRPAPKPSLRQPAPRCPGRWRGPSRLDLDGEIFKPIS